MSTRERRDDDDGRLHGEDDIDDDGLNFCDDFSPASDEEGGKPKRQTAAAGEDERIGTDQLESMLNEVEAELDREYSEEEGDANTDESEESDEEEARSSRATKDGDSTDVVEGFDFEEFLGDEATSDTEQELPEYACAYCHVSDPLCVVKCLDCEEKSGGKCAKWFCNGRPRGSGYSCIVQHMVRARHKQIQLHSESPLGDTILECYSTGNRNVFQLGFVPAKSENVVVLLTREVCLNRSQLEEMSWDPEEWLPLIKDGEFRSWLVKTPSDRELLRSRQVSKEQIVKLEDLWKTNHAAKLEDVERGEGEDDVAHVLPCYEDGFQYQNIFGPLVKMEADEDKMMKESQTQEGLAIDRWDRSLNKKHVAVFRPNTTDGGEVRVIAGDELVLKRLMGGGELWQSRGIVRRVENGVVHLEMQEKNVPNQYLDRFVLDFVWKSVTFDRMQATMKTFALDDDSVSQYIFHKLLGHLVVPQILQISAPQRYSAPGLPELNHSQAEAVKAVLQMPMALIQGPPGTGKTVTSASLLYHLSRQQGVGQILVCAPSNVAVEQLAEKIHRTGLRVVRVAARSREHVEGNVEELCLHNMVRALGSVKTETKSGRGYRKRGKGRRRDLRKLFELKDTVGELSTRDDRKLRSLTRELEQDILRNAQVICTTCVGAGDPRLRKFRFRTVLIDEATQATEPECLIPITKGCRRLVLVGDHCQLGPVVMCKRAASAGLSQSLFERLVILGIRPVPLCVQYRMHPSLSEFPSNTFYEGTLQNGVTEEERVLKGVDFPWPRPECPMFFYVNAGAEEIGASGTSFLNRTEATAVERIVTTFLKGGCTPDQIGVVTPYEGQRAFVESYMERHGAMRTSLYREIEVTSVDAFQGREKDLIILSCVRSNERQGIGFLSDPRRLNVAMTRAKYGCIIVGNPNVLSRHMLWNNLLVHFKERGVLVEGSLNNLKPCMMKFRPARKYYNRRKYQMSAHMHGRVEDRGADHEREEGSSKDRRDGMMVPAFPGGPMMRDLVHESPMHGMLDVPQAGQNGYYPPKYAANGPYDPRYYTNMQERNMTNTSSASSTSFTQQSRFSQDSAMYSQTGGMGATQDSVAFPQGRYGKGMFQSQSTQDDARVRR